LFHSQESSNLWRKLSLAAVVAGFFLAASCSDQPSNQAANQPANQPAKAAEAAKKPEAAAKPASVSSKTTEPPQLVTVPKGTAITATVGQILATGKSKPGDSFAARLSTPVTIDGKVVIPKGAQVTGRVVTVKKHELKVALASLKLHGKSYDLTTNSIRSSEKTQAQNNGKDTAAQDKNGKDNKNTLRAQTQLTFKLTKPVTVPVKG
jgi:hypothetical protein